MLRRAERVCSRPGSEVRGESVAGALWVSRAPASPQPTPSQMSLFSCAPPNCPRRPEGKASDVFQMEAQASGAPREDSIWPGAVPLGEIPRQAAGLGLTEQGAGRLWGARG